MEIKSTSGQATVELAVMFPVVIIIAVIAINSLLYFGYCASFDRSFRQIVSATASSPAAGIDIGKLKSDIENQLNELYDEENLNFDVEVHAVDGGCHQYLATLKMFPTLFGLGLKSEILGIPLPSLNHSSQMTVETYKPGVIF